MTESDAGFLGRILGALRHARRKHPNEEGVLTDAEWLAVLTEEVGECARAIQDESDAALQDELAQVAAVAMRWAVSIPRGRKRPPWATGQRRLSRAELAAQFGWDAETQRLALLHAADPAVGFDADLESRIQAFAAAE